jgi:exodeoxyribonuclease VII small subunit
MVVCTIVTRGGASADGAASLANMKPKRKPNPNPIAETELNLTFEQAIDQLEKIVSDMEQAELPLEDVLKKYEEGTGLVRFCAHKLDEAEKKIEMLARQPGGSVALKAFTSDAGNADTINDGDNETASNEGSLF